MWCLRLMLLMGQLWFAWSPLVGLVLVAFLMWTEWEMSGELEEDEPLEVAMELAVVQVVLLEQEEPGLVQELVEHLALVPMVVVLE